MDVEAERVEEDMGRTADVTEDSAGYERPWKWKRRTGFRN